MIAARSKVNKLRSSVIILTGGTSVYLAYSAYTGDTKLYQNAIMPSLRWFDTETSHALAVKLINFLPQWRVDKKDANVLECELWGKKFPNPVGIAAGFDKNGTAIDGMFRVGSGFAEVGSVTPLPQPGNEKPRVFRLNEDRAVINRYGFNSEGHTKVLDRVSEWRRGNDEKVLGVNLGKNKTSQDAVGDYVSGVNRFGHVADYLVVNVSSPNTPGLRALQARDTLPNLLEKVLDARNRLQCAKKPLIFIKISPDLLDEDRKTVAKTIIAKKTRVDGVIVSNTTVERSPGLKSRWKDEVGGLSGAPLRQKATETIREMYKLTDGKVPIIGCGGVFTGRDAYEKVRAGASLIQLYTSLVFLGPTVVRDIQTQLTTCLRDGGFQSVSEAVGADHRK